MTAALRMLAYGVMADLMDEYLRIGESTAMECFKLFVQAVNSKFSTEYLRSPTQDDVARLLAIGASRGFPGMLGSIDCMHWKWKNCPNAWKGSHNDINVLERSSVFTNLAEGRAPLINYSLNGHDYTMGYYLADGNKRKNFAAAQESARKDVERAFGVLQARFGIVRGPARLHKPEMLKEIMMACII
ncbi:uncharacterized protein LOC132162210 [Corylus avellana]|uniref:uncharacterized protein LOC132162210 n=1 Tax=Corylus avellana TaxID=13451 RepID=UPI00286C61A7|nr:uncharacterized protein LOC132162210 [Corylus avellana]